MSEQVSPISYVEWGHQVSKSYLEDGVSMNDGIAKIADQNDLLPAQIQRVCEIANHRTYQQLYKSSEDKTFNFDLAEPGKIIDALETEQVKVSHDYFGLPKATGSVDVNQIFNVNRISNAPDVDERVKRAEAAIEKLAAAREEANRRLIVVRQEIVDCEQEFYKMAKQMVINGTPLEDIWGAARELGNEEQMVDIFVKTAQKMADEGLFGAKLQYLMKKKAEAVDPNLISDKLKSLSKPVGVQVVNGRHPIVMALNTLAGKKKDEQKLYSVVYTIDEKDKYVKSRIKDLNSSRKVDQFVGQE